MRARAEALRKRCPALPPSCAGASPLLLLAFCAGLLAYHAATFAPGLTPRSAPESHAESARLPPQARREGRAAVAAPWQSERLPSGRRSTPWQAGADEVQEGPLLFPGGGGQAAVASRVGEEASTGQRRHPHQNPEHPNVRAPPPPPPPPTPPPPPPGPAANGKRRVTHVGNADVGSRVALHVLQDIYIPRDDRHVGKTVAYSRQGSYPAVRRLPPSEKKRILVTGGAGFVGSHLVDRLMLMGHEVIVLDNFFTGSKRNVQHWVGHPNFELIRHDVVDPFMAEVDQVRGQSQRSGSPMRSPRISRRCGLIRGSCPSIWGVCRQIYHLACPASPPHYQYNPIKTVKTNVMGTINMLGLAKRTKARFLLSSTSEVYGDPEEHPQRETYWGHVNPIGPRACYDEGKRVAETLTYSYMHQDDVDVRVARIFNTFGPRMNQEDGRVVSNFIMQTLRGKNLTIYGDGSQTRSFQYIHDLVDGLILLMARNYSEPVNLGNPEEFTIYEFARFVRDHVNRAASIRWMPATMDDPRKRRPDISRAKTFLGWQPRFSVSQGIQETVEYFRRNWRDAEALAGNSRGDVE